MTPPPEGSRGAKRVANAARPRLTYRDRLTGFSQVRGYPSSSARLCQRRLDCFGTKRPPVQVRPPRPRSQVMYLTRTRPLCVAYSSDYAQVPDGWHLEHEPDPRASHAGTVRERTEPRA